MCRACLGTGRVPVTACACRVFCGDVREEDDAPDAVCRSLRRPRPDEVSPASVSGEEK